MIAQQKNKQIVLNQLPASYAKQRITMKHTALLHTVAEGDLAYACSAGLFAGAPFVFHDRFRVAKGRANEHRDVMVAA